MKLLWQIEESDIEKVRAFYESQKKSLFVQRRIDRNVNRHLPAFTHGIFWEAMISCLITTQQRSGPYSSVTEFVRAKPFPLDYEKCKASADVGRTAADVITAFGGLRRGITIGEEVAVNLGWLEQGGWQFVDKIVDELDGRQKAQQERRCADMIRMSLKGFGPKQSRNLLQSLGLTRYEIPVDSRITKWLSDFGFPVKLTAVALSDENYYNLVLDGFQAICAASDIYPCLMDASIFSSFDDDWPEDRIVW